MSKETLYIVRTPFNGVIINTIHNGLVDFTGKRVTDTYINERGSEVHDIKYSGIPFEEYKEQRRKEKGDKYADSLKVVTQDELYELMKDYEKSQVTPWEEVSEERFEEMLNVLPPMGWTDIPSGFYFYIVEAYYGRLHSCFAKYRGKYFEGRRIYGEKRSDVLGSLLEAYEKNR